jgi:cytochrome c oxidase subunit 3
MTTSRARPARRFPLASDEHAGHPGLAHHFDSYAQQKESATLGMWLFIVQEVLFFGGLFTAYALYRWKYPIAFDHASLHLDIVLGTFNTAVLLASSLTMAMAVRCAETGKVRKIVGFLLATGALGSVFLGVKAFEYHHKWVEHLVPGPLFRFEGPGGENARLFFSLYFGMTGLHALHMVVGIAILLCLLRPAWKGKFTPESHNMIEGFGLYWHFVDIIWIFLFPLLYLPGRHPLP